MNGCSHVPWSTCMYWYLDAFSLRPNHNSIVYLILAIACMRHINTRLKARSEAHGRRG